MLLIGTAGAVGAVSRYAVGIVAVRLLGPRFAFGTLAVNVLGCLLLGVLLEFDRNTGAVSHPWRMLAVVGFLGAFTTFSSFGYETFRYVADGESHLAMMNVAANLLLGLGAVWLGWWIARLLTGGV